MKSFSTFVALMVATTGAAIAAPAFNPVPEPGSLALVGLAVGALALVSRKGKK